MHNFITLNKLGSEIKVIVRQSVRAKRVSIKIMHGNVILVLPNKDFQTGYNFLLQKEAWIRKHLNSLSTNSEICNKSLPIFNNSHLIEHIESKKSEIYFKENVIHVQCPANKLNIILKRFLRDYLFTEITKKAEKIRSIHNLNYNNIKIINSRTKWGSCSSKAVISFNWRLIFVPSDILQYIIAHEMCHIQEMSHSKQFWQIVAGIYPDYKKAKLWLKQNCNLIYQYLK